jgi:hypothetical protein
MAPSDLLVKVTVLILGLAAPAVYRAVDYWVRGRSALRGYELSRAEVTRRSENLTLTLVFLALALTLAAYSSAITTVVIEATNPGLNLNYVFFGAIVLYALGLILAFSAGPRIKGNARWIGERIIHEVAPKPVQVPPGATGDGGEAPNVEQPESRP